LCQAAKLGPKHCFAGADDNDAALPDLVEILRIAGIGDTKLVVDAANAAWRRST